MTSAPRSASDKPAAGPMIMCDSSSTLMPRNGNSALSMKGEGGAALIGMSLLAGEDASMIAGVGASRVAVFHHRGILVWECPGKP
ncbi:hypothetical protein D3C78_1535450 [compost metagenome]